MDPKWRQHGDILETTWKQNFLQTMETNMETTMETNGDSMETKC
jgi:hypothetical protein